MAKKRASGFQFEFQLTGAGWAAAELADDFSSATVTASYLGEPLAVLLDAVTALVEGASQTACSWDEEPGEFRWLFNLRDDTVQLTILERRRRRRPRSKRLGNRGSRRRRLVRLAGLPRPARKRGPACVSLQM